MPVTFEQGYRPDLKLTNFEAVLTKGRGLVNKVNGFGKKGALIRNLAGLNGQPLPPSNLEVDLGLDSGGAELYKEEFSFFDRTIAWFNYTTYVYRSLDLAVLSPSADVFNFPGHGLGTVAGPRQGWSTNLLVSDLGYQAVGCNDLPELKEYIKETRIKSDVLVKKLI